MMGLFSSFLEDYLEVSQGGERIVRVLVAVIGPFSKQSKKTGRLDIPARNTFDLVIPIGRYLHDDSHCHMITRYGPLTKVVRNMRVTVKITRLSNR